MDYILSSEIIGSKGHVTAMKFNGRDNESELTMKADQVVFAIGQAACDTTKDIKAGGKVFTLKLDPFQNDFYKSLFLLLSHKWLHHYLEKMPRLSEQKMEESKFFVVSAKKIK